MQATVPLTLATCQLLNKKLPFLAKGCFKLVLYSHTLSMLFQQRNALWRFGRTRISNDKATQLPFLPTGTMPVYVQKRIRFSLVV